MCMRLAHATHHANFSKPYHNWKEGPNDQTASSLNIHFCVGSMWLAAARYDLIRIIIGIIPKDMSCLVEVYVGMCVKQEIRMTVSGFLS